VKTLDEAVDCGVLILCNTGSRVECWDGSAAAEDDLVTRPSYRPLPCPSQRPVVSGCTDREADLGVSVERPAVLRCRQHRSSESTV